MNDRKNKNFLSVSISLIILIFTCTFLLSIFLIVGCSKEAKEEDKIDVGEEPSAREDPNVLVKENQETAEENPTETEEADENEEDKDNGDNEGDETGDKEDSENGDTTTETKEEEPQELTINVYYADSAVQYLVGEERIIPPNHKYLSAFNELLKPPLEPGHIKLVPDTTKVNKINFDSGNINLDLSSEFVEDRFKSDAVDVLLVYSIVNTFTEFSEVNTVTFYVNGKRLNTLGQLDISQPLYKDTSWIKKD